MIITGHKLSRRVCECGLKYGNFRELVPPIAFSSAFTPFACLGNFFHVFSFDVGQIKKCLQNVCGVRQLLNIHNFIE